MCYFCKELFSLISEGGFLDRTEERSHFSPLSASRTLSYVDDEPETDRSVSTEVYEIPAYAETQSQVLI